MCVCVCMYVCMYVFIYICVCVCVCVYLCGWIGGESICVNMFSLVTGGVRYILSVTRLASSFAYVDFSLCYFQGVAFQINNDLLPD